MPPYELVQHDRDIRKWTKIEEGIKNTLGQAIKECLQEEQVQLAENVMARCQRFVGEAARAKIESEKTLATPAPLVDRSENSVSIMPSLIGYASVQDRRYDLQPLLKLRPSASTIVMSNGDGEINMNQHSMPWRTNILAWRRKT